MCMIEHIDRAATMSTDLPDDPPPALGEPIRTGQRGRPRKNIDPAQLASLSVGRAKRTVVAEKFNCCARTIKRRLVEYGYSAPGPPVYIETTDETGNIIRTYHPGTCSDLSNLTDLELDQLLLDIHTQFPSFGRRLLDGCLLQMGHRVPKQRLKLSYSRVVGPSDHHFGPRRLYRRVYSVAGPNSLWHHDGQHGKSFPSNILYSYSKGLVHWKIYIHGFVDGDTRFVVGMRAHNNNRAQTVGDLFEDICMVWGYPSRVRGDCGTENVLVAARMEEVRGPNRGSYIFGR